MVPRRLPPGPNAPRRQKPPPPQAFFQLPQERVQRRTVEQIVDFAPMVQILVVLVPLVVMDGVQDRILQQLTEQILTEHTEQEIEVPKISSPTVG